MYIPVPFTSFRVHPHLFFEMIAYVVGISTVMVLRHRRKEIETARAFDETLWLAVAALVGAIVGAKLLAFAESPQEYWAVRDVPGSWIEGKTIVGGLAGGWLGVEILKKIKGIKRSTGDAWVLPLCVSIAIGRLGCFFTGLPDQTYGTFSQLPWAVDFGDGPRHPTQLYESAFVLLLAVPLFIASRKGLAPGQLFRWFLLAYMAFRFAVEFFKPSYKPYAGLSAIQITAALLILYLLIFELRPFRRGTPIEQTSS